MQVSGINNLSSISKIGEINSILGENKTSTDKFSSILSDALNKVNDLQIESDKATTSFLSGETDNIHNVMITASKANLALQMTIQVRNKVMDAYNEIMNMQV